MASNRLTWDQVRAPDFEGVLDGFIASSNLIGNAMKTAQGGLDRIKATQTENADNAVMSKLLQYQGSPDRLTADLGSGAFQGSVDMSKISAGMREHLSKAPTELLKFAADKSDYDQTQQRIGDQQKFRDNNEMLVQYNHLRQFGKPGEAEAFFEANLDRFTGLNYGMLNGVEDSNSKGYSANIRNWDDRQDYDIDVRTDRINQAFNQIQGRATDAGVLPGDTEGAIRWMNKNWDTLGKDFSRDEMDAAFARYSGNLGGAGGAGGSGGGAVGGTGSSSFDGSFESAIGSLIDREGGYVAKDGRSGAPANFGINQKANPDIDVKNLTRPQAEQLYRDRYWKPIEAAGVPAAAREAVFDFGVNAGVGRSLEFWQKSGGDINKFNELRLAHYRRQPDYEQNKESWEGRVAATSGGLASPRDTQVLTQSNNAFNQSYNPQSVQAREALAATNDNRGALEIAQELTGDKGPFKGEDATAMAKLIQEEADANHISPAAVVWAMKRHSVGTGGFDIDKWMDDRGGKLFQWIFTDGLKGRKNEEGFRQSINFVRDRDALLKQVRADDEMQRTAQALTAASGRVTQLQGTIDERNAMSRRLGMRNAPDNSFYEEELGKARSLEKLAGQAATTASLAGDTSLRVEPEPDTSGLTNTTRVDLAPVPKGVKAAQAVLRLGNSSEISKRQRAQFERNYGHSPEEIINNPGLLAPAVENAISPRDALRNQAHMAIAGGAATIAAFTRDNGIDPRKFLQN